jgi:GNAT superfamily N-acetyltransferase
MTELGYPTEPEEMAQRLVGVLGDPTYAMFAAQVRGTIAGLCGVAIHRYLEKNGLYARIVALVVSGEYQGIGVGSALIRAAEVWAVKQQATDLIVNSGMQRAGAHRFYRSRGYAQTGVRFVKGLEPSAG